MYLIEGNHDIKNLNNKMKRNGIRAFYPYKEINDNGRKVILCHYPMPFYKRDYNPSVYHLYGHLHETLEEQFMREIKKMINEKNNRKIGKNQCNFYNVGCMCIGYTPKTLDEIIEIYKEKG